MLAATRAPAIFSEERHNLCAHTRACSRGGGGGGGGRGGGGGDGGREREREEGEGMRRGTILQV